MNAVNQSSALLPRKIRTRKSDSITNTEFLSVENNNVSKFLLPEGILMPTYTLDSRSCPFLSIYFFIDAKTHIQIILRV